MSDWTADDDVVIVGMACRYPDAHSPDELWQNVLSRRRSFRPIPPRRLPLSEYGGDGVDQTYLSRAAVLDGWTFDRQRFRVPGDTFRAVDQTHWLALDVSAAALADAGLPDGDGLDRARTGVVLGNSLTGEFSRTTTLRMRWPYVRRALRSALAGANLPAAVQDEIVSDVEREFKAPFPAPSDETLAGALSNTIAGRICNFFDFGGAGYTVDAACASSLLAVATGADAIASGRLDVVLAGGVDLSLDPLELVGFARVGALARDDMRVYDARPTGFLPGEGCGVVVLCRASYARRTGLRPYARLLGWATSSDGSGGLTRPEVAGQRTALTRAYRNARLDPGLVGLIEGHGTGTDVGDATELRSLVEVRRTSELAHPAPPAALGSVKANIGHTKAAAGVAGLIKAALAVHHGVLPPTTGCEQPHPRLAEARHLLAVTDEARPWPANDRYAAVSAMGFGGINAHAVLGGTTPLSRRSLSLHERRLSRRHPRREVVVCGADSPEALAATLTAVLEAAPRMSRPELTDLAASLAAAHPGGAPARFGAAVSDCAELAAAVRYALEQLAAGEKVVLDRARRVFLSVGAPLRVGLLFSGQAAPVYADAGALTDLLDELPEAYGDRLPVRAEAVAATSVAQPAILRASLAGLRWLEALGVRAAEALGHSLGEIAALVWAGALSETDAYALVKVRGEAMAAASDEGGMASLAADAATATALLPGSGAVLAADNGDRQAVVSGRRSEVAHVLAAAARRGIAATWLPVAHAFHSPLMAPAGDAVRAAAAGIDWRAPVRPVASTITGAWWRRGDDPAELLVRQLTEPVRFREALGRLTADLLVEVGPGQVLTGLAGERAVAMDAGGRSGDDLATATAALFAAGVVEDVQPYFSRRFTRAFDPARPRTFLTSPCEAAADGTATEPATTKLAATGPAVTEPADRADPGHRTVPAGAVEPLDGTDPVRVATALVAAAVELDPAAVRPDSRLLADLHLSSLRVSQLAAEAATVLGRAQPAAPLSLATATVAEFAAAIAELPPAGEADPLPAPGVASWVRAFRHDLVPQPAPDDAPAGDRDWHVVGDLTGHPLAGAVRAAFPAAPGAAPAVLLALPPGLDRLPVDDLVAALRVSAERHHPLVVVHHSGVGGAAGRSLAAEHPDVPVLVVEVPADPAGIALAAAESRRWSAGYREVVYPSHEVRTVPVTRPLEVAARRDGAIPLRRGEVCVVTGGAKGIGAECAVVLAAATGARLVLLGRSPHDDPAVAATVRRVAGTGAAVSYHTVDLGDAAAVAAVLAGVRAEHGPVRALLHAAGRNEPAPIARLTADRLAAVLAPKVTGLTNVLAALDPDELRVAVTFGSVIGRTGLAGEADYAIANDWLARRCAELTATAPGVRWLNIEWSAWSDAGMGVRLGALDGLLRQGLSPIPVSEGVDLLLRLLATPALPPTVMVAGRLPATATLTWAGDAPEVRARFLESERSHTPGVELVADAKLSVGTDPYLADHRIDGTPVLPAVFAMEGIAQAAAALGVKPVPAVFRDVTLSRPVTVPERADRGLRIAVLTRPDAGLAAVVRSDETRFAVDHVRAGYDNAADDPPPARPPRSEPLIEARPLYGPLFFHGPRFHRVRGFHGLSAYRCTASIAATPGGRWFAAFHHAHLELGDPGARDAFLHALQGCVPDRRVLPVGVDRITIYQRPDGELVLDARQRAEDPDGFVFDVTVSDASGSVVEHWSGLRLRAVGPTEPGRWPLELLGPYLARSLRRWQPEVDLDLAVVPATRTDRRRTRDLASWLTGRAVDHAPDGRLLVTGTPGAAPTVSASHLDTHLLVAAGAGPVGIDWARVGAVADPDPVAGELGAGDEAATRAWTCREVTRKLGLPPDAPLVYASAGPDRWTRVTSGDYRLFSTVVDTVQGPVAVCVGTR